MLCRIFWRVALYLSFMQRVVKFLSFFGFPRSKQVPDFFLDARYFFYLIITHQHECKKFEFYFYYLFFDN